MRTPDLKEIDGFFVLNNGLLIGKPPLSCD